MVGMGRGKEQSLSTREHWDSWMWEHKGAGREMKKVTLGDGDMALCLPEVGNEGITLNLRTQ